MSVMLEHAFALPCPCTQDCSGRSGTCRLTCEKYKPYEAGKRAEYAARAKVKAAAEDALAGWRKARERKSRMKHRHHRT